MTILKRKNQVSFLKTYIVFICFLFFYWLANKSQPSDQVHEKSQRLQMAEQHRLNGNIAFKSNNYQQSIDLYTKSLMLDKTNPVVYMNRAIARE